MNGWRFDAGGWKEENSPAALFRREAFGIPPAAVLIIDDVDSLNASPQLILSRFLDVPPETIIIHKDRWGRPALDTAAMPGCPAAARIDFSVAHSGNAFAFGIVAGGRTGVDIELIAESPDLAGVARDHFTPAERARIDSLPAHERLAAFYEVWTAKEAFVKVQGAGMSFGLDQVETEKGDGGALRIARVMGREELARGWRLAHFRQALRGTEAVLAVVISKP
jgi:phosphopantetheinyl transferase (holo-ACP synthase)